MNVPGFNAESSLRPNKGLYRGKNAFAGSGSAENVRGLVRPAATRQEYCVTTYRAIHHHWFPATLCTPIRVDSALDTLTTFGSRGSGRMFAPGGVRSLKSAARSVTDFGALQDCREVTLPFIADVYVTQSCDDHFPDTSTMVVQDHPELTAHWIGGIDEIPPPYNPGWFKLKTVCTEDGDCSPEPPVCECCVGFVRCGKDCVFCPPGKTDCCKTSPA